MSHLTFHQISSLIDIENKARDTAYLIKEIVSNMDAESVLNNISELFKKLPNRNVCHVNGTDTNKTRHVMDVLSVTEDVYNQYTKLHRTRKINDSNTVITHNIRLCGKRLERILWDLSLSIHQRLELNNVFKKSDVTMQLWEDVPAPLDTDNKRDYNNTNVNNGVVVFHHCYGFTFIEYKKGMIRNGWSCPLAEILNYET